MESLGLGTLGSLCGLGTPGRLCGWVSGGQGVSGVGLQILRVSGVGHFLESLGWALQGVSRSRPGEEKSSGRGEELSLTSNNPTPKVGNDQQVPSSVDDGCSKTRSR